MQQILNARCYRYKWEIHWFAIRVWDTYMRYVYEIPVCDTCMRYWYAIPVWDAGMRYVYEILVSDTYAIPKWDTGRWYVYEILVCDTGLRYVYKVQWCAITLCDTGMRYHYVIPVWGSESLFEFESKIFEFDSKSIRIQPECGYDVGVKKKIVWKFLKSVKLPQNF